MVWDVSLPEVELFVRLELTNGTTFEVSAECLAAFLTEKRCDLVMNLFKSGVGERQICATAFTFKLNI